MALERAGKPAGERYQLWQVVDACGFKRELPMIPKPYTCWIGGDSMTEACDAMIESLEHWLCSV